MSTYSAIAGSAAGFAVHHIGRMHWWRRVDIVGKATIAACCLGAIWFTAFAFAALALALVLLGVRTDRRITKHAGLGLRYKYHSEEIARVAGHPELLQDAIDRYESVLKNQVQAPKLRRDSSPLAALKR